MCAAFDIGATSFGEVMRILDDESCRELILSYDLNGFESAQFFKTLKSNTTLTSLEVNDNLVGGLGKSTFQVVVDSLQTNATLKRLLLLWPDSFCADVADDIGLRLAKAVIWNSSLIELKFSAGKLTDMGGVPVAEALGTNSVLRRLAIYDGSYLTDKFGISLADALRKNRTLTDICLYHVNLGDKACTQLAEMLGTNAALRRFSVLELHGRLGDISGKAFADALRINSGLISFELCGHHCGVETARLMAEAVAINMTLRVLWLEGGRISFDDAAQHFAKAMETNYRVSKLTILNDPFEMSCDAMPRPAELRRNQELITIESHVRLMSRKSQSVQALCDVVSNFPSMVFEYFLPPTSAFHAQARFRSPLGRGPVDIVENSSVPERVSEKIVFLPGMRVEAHALIRTELNGKRGKVQGMQGNRVQVTFDEPLYGGKALKPSNVRIVDEIPTNGLITLPVVHIDPPARIEPAEAAAVVAQQEAGWIERLAQSTTQNCTLSEPRSGLGDGQLTKIELKRCPRGLPEALATGKPLQACRSALEEGGHSWKMPCGNMIFVNPWQYRAARHAIVRFPESNRFSIFFTASFEHLIEETLINVGQGALAKSRHYQYIRENESDHATVASRELDDSTLDGPWRDCGIRRTFVDFVPALADASSVVQSSTEAHRGGTNPRRLAFPPEI